MDNNEKDTRLRSAVPQKEFVSFMVHKMAKNQKDLFQSFCDIKGFNYAPAITFLLEFYEAFKKENKKNEVEKNE